MQVEYAKATLKSEAQAPQANAPLAMAGSRHCAFAFVPVAGAPKLSRACEEPP
jgi:hypothetical protein